jgi:hypothetical protein
MSITKAVENIPVHKEKVKDRHCLWMTSQSITSFIKEVILGKIEKKFEVQAVLVNHHLSL